MKRGVSPWIAWAIAVAACPTPGSGQEFMEAPALVEEVISKAPSPYAFDWRRIDYELEVGYDYVDEFNNFDTDGVHVAVGLPVMTSSLMRLGVRRYWVHDTESSRLVGRTPFKQAAQSTRYEIFGELDYNVLQGRSISPLSPIISDLEHAVFAVLGMHYGHPNQGMIPARDDKPPAKAGQEVVEAKFVAELGARWHIYLPQSVGLFFAITRQFPRGGAQGTTLIRWNQLTGGLLWAIGGD